jgi:hypothetical protein
VNELFADVDRGQRDAEYAQRIGFACAGRALSRNAANRTPAIEHVALRRVDHQVAFGGVDVRVVVGDACGLREVPQPTVGPFRQVELGKQATGEPEKKLVHVVERWRCE